MGRPDYGHPGEDNGCPSNTDRAGGILEFGRLLGTRPFAIKFRRVAAPVPAHLRESTRIHPSERTLRSGNGGCAVRVLVQRRSTSCLSRDAEHTAHVSIEFPLPRRLLR